MNRIPRSSSRSWWRSPVAWAAGVALALGLGAAGCGPKQKFCVDAGDYVCHPLPDASPMSDVMDTGPQDKGSIFIGGDSSAVDLGLAVDAGSDAD